MRSDSRTDSGGCPVEVLEVRTDPLDGNAASCEGARCDVVHASPAACAELTEDDRRQQVIAAERLTFQQKLAQESFDRGYPTTERLTLIDRLKELGIEMSQLQFLGHLFGPWKSYHQTWRFDERTMRMDPRGWRPARHKLTSLDILADHFLQRRAVLSTPRCFLGHHQTMEGEFDFAAPATRQVILDLDVHNVGQLNSIDERYRTIRELIVPEPLVFRTGDSGGLQVIWLVDDFVYVHWVVKTLSEGLRAAGCPVGPEYGIEIFPTERMAPVRMPLGAFGALLDPSTLQPVRRSLAEICELIQKNYEDKEHAHDVFFRSATLPGQVPKHMVDGALPVSGAGVDGSQMPRHAHDLDAMVWEHGLSVDFPRQKAVPCVIRHAYYGRGRRNEEELTNTVMDWFRRKHNGLSDRFLSDPQEVGRDIALQVRKHLEWAGGRVSANYVRPVEGVRLSIHDYRMIVEVAQKFGGGLAQLGRRKRHMGLADLLAYVKSRSDANLILPIPIPVTAMLKFTGWDRNKQNHRNEQSHGYYGAWLGELDRLGLLKVVDSDYRPGGGRGRCRTYALRHRFVDRDLVDGSHEETFRRLEEEGTLSRMSGS